MDNQNNYNNQNNNGSINNQTIEGTGQIKLSQLVNNSNGVVNNTNPNGNVWYDGVNNQNQVSANQKYYSYMNDNRNKPIITDNDLLIAFIGKNYNKIIRGKFNFAGFFFNTLYLLYRKRYGYAFVLTLLCVIASLLMQNILYSILLILIISIFIGFTFNKNYVQFAKKKILKIRYLTVTIDMETIKNVCRKKGGTSVSKMVLVGVVHVIVIILMIFSVMFFLFRTQFNRVIKMMGLNDLLSPILNVIEKYDDTLKRDNKIKIGEIFSVDIPDGFRSESSDYTYKLSHDDACHFDFYAISNYKDVNALIDGSKEYYINAEKDDIGERTINNIKWNSVSFSEKSFKQYYHATNVNDQIYLVSYYIKNIDSDFCNSYANNVLEIINYKENN